MQLVSLNSSDQQVIALFDEIDRLLASLYPVPCDQTLSLAELNQPNVHAIGLQTEEGIIACGAIVKMFEGSLYGEIKRVYVKPNHRGKGLSRRIMQNLMYFAGQAQIPVLRLETGNKQKESIALYESLGFERCGSFGNYRESDTSVFMEMSLAQ